MAADEPVPGHSAATLAIQRDRHVRRSVLQRRDSAEQLELVNKIKHAAEAIRFLDGADSLGFVQDCKRNMRALCPALPGQHVLDVRQSSVPPDRPDRHRFGSERGNRPQLPRLCREAGLENVRLLPQTCSVPYFVYAAMTKSAMRDALAAGTPSAEEFRRWWDEMETAERNGRCFATFSGFIVAGRKPDVARRP